MLARLLVPTDFSQASQQTLGYAADLAAALGAELSVLHVGHGAPSEVRHLGDFADRWGGGRVATLIERRADDPTAAILDAAANADLVVMAPRGATGRGSGLGSVAGAVARRAGVPVLLLSRHAPRPLGARIRVAVDLGEASASALRTARALAAALGGSVDVVHAVEDASLATAWGGEPAGDERDAQLRRVERFVAQAGGADVPLAVRLAEGSPEAAAGDASGAPGLVVAGRSADASSVDRLFAAVGSVPTLHVPA